jgi:hypothetical protein
VSLKISGSSYSSATAALLGPDGKAVGGSSFFGTSGGFVDSRTLPATGTYTLFVDPPYATTGSATITLYDVPPDISGTIAPGGPSVSPSIATPGQNAKYTFDGTAGQRISLKVGPSSMSMAWVSITNPNGTPLVSSTLFSTFETFVDTRVLPATGKYTLLVDPYNDATGSATVTLYDVPADATAALDVGGPPQTIAITTPGQNARATFAGHAGQTVNLTLSGVTVSISFVSILKPDGTTLVSGTLVGTFGRTITATTPVDGNYTIVIDPQNAASGSMTLGIA